MYCLYNYVSHTMTSLSCTETKELTQRVGVISGLPRPRNTLVNVMSTRVNIGVTLIKVLLWSVSYIINKNGCSPGLPLSPFTPLPSPLIVAFPCPPLHILSPEAGCFFTEFNCLAI